MDLVQELKNQTQILKEEYLEKTEQWAKEQVQRNIERRDRYYNMTIRQISKDKNPKLELVSSDLYWKEQKWAYNTPSFHFTQEFIPKQIKAAEQHYEASIIKLAARIEKKELDQSKLKLTTARVGVNIETTITDGTKVVRAWTIVASGEVQRPHYRYLIK